MSEKTISSLDAQVANLSDADWGDLSLVNSFWDVAYTIEEHDQLVAETDSDEFWATTGVKSVIRAWNSAAFDEADNTFYFFGGGHANYGGNEVYSLDLDTMEWARLTDPAPVDFTTNDDGARIGLPRVGPTSPHTYDGLSWNETTQTMWLTSTFTGFGRPGDPDKKEVWQFDPATGEWSSTDSTSNMRYGSSVYMPETGQTLSLHNAAYNYVYASLFEPDGTESYLGLVEGLRLAETTFRNPDTGEIYTTAVDTIQKLTIGPDGVTTETAAELPTLTDLNIPIDFTDAGYAYRPVDGKFYIWNGGERIVSWDPDTNDFKVIWNESDPEAPSSDIVGAGRVFDKWVYLDEQDAFVGIAAAEEGMVVWKPGDNPSDVNQPNIGTAEIDYNTTGAIGVFVPLLSGDRDYDGSAKLWYRAEGADTWLPAMDLMRIRPELNQAAGESPEGFAGSVFGLDAGTSYEFKVEVIDADGVQGESVQTLSASTKTVPVRYPQDARVVDVYDAPGLQAALDDARAGDVIQVNPGTYTLSRELRFEASGTAENPIVVRGLDRSSTIIDAQNGNGFYIKGDHVHIEDMSIVNTSQGVAFRDADFLTVRGNYIQVNDTDGSGQKGINGFGDDTYIVDNILEGPFDFGRIDTGGGDRGIDAGGHNVEIAYNTISGFLDAIAGSNDNAVGVEIHHNEVLWSTDNGIELDHGLRNLSAHHNRLSNTTDAMSAQTVNGGPAYIFDNVLLNVGNTPLKMKPLGQAQSQGVYFVNNTIAKEGAGWSNDSGRPSQVFVLNNLFLGQGTNDKGDTLRNLSDHRLIELDYNAWLTDGRFRLDLSDVASVSEDSFADFQANTQFGQHSLLLADEKVFENYTLDFDENGFFTFRDPEGTDFTLDANSSAVDAGIVLANINDDFTGSAPDLGAVETGDGPVHYGARVTLEPATAPFAMVDSVYTEVDNSVTFNPAENDWDPNGDPIEVTAINQPAEGTAVLNPDGTVTYTPSAGFTGDVSFSYTLSDSNGEQSTGSIGLTVTPPNDAPIAGDDSAKLEQDTGLRLSISDLLSNDSDPNGDTLSITHVAGAANGTVNLSGDDVVYTPEDGFLGTDSFTYTLSDGRGGEVTGTVALEVVSDGIVLGSVGNDSFDLATATTGQIVDALAGRDTVIGSAFADEINGGADADELFGGEGDDSFLVSGHSGADDVAGGAGIDRIVGSDGDDTIGLASVTGIEAIDGGAGMDVIKGTDDGRQKWDFSAVELTGIELIDAGGHNNLVRGSQGDDRIAANGYIDELHGEGGDDVFLYSGSNAGADTLDGGAGLDRVQGSDGDDRIALDAFSGIEAIDGGAGRDVIAGSDGGREEWDFSGVELTGIELIDAGGHHDLVIGSAGDDAFRAGAGDDTFDGAGGIDVVHFAGNFADYDLRQKSDRLVVEALVTGEGRDKVTNVEALQFADGVYRDGAFHAGEVVDGSVSDPDVDPNPEPSGPTASDDAVSVDEDGRVSFDPLANDSVRAGTVIDGLTAPQHGTVSQDDAGQLVYVPDADFNGTDSFDYTLADADGNRSTARVSVTVASVNDAPVADNDAAQTESETAVTIEVLANDSDVDGDGLSVSGVDSPDHGTVTANGDGTLTYTPSAGVAGSQTFGYTVADGAGGTASARVTVDVAADTAAQPEVYGTVSADQIDVSGDGGGRAVYALEGDDWVLGSDYADQIDGGAGSDRLHGGAGDDTFAFAGSSAVDDLVDGGTGNDTVIGSAGDDVLGARSFVAVEAIDGGAGTDVIRGTDGGREEWDFSAVELTGIELIDAGGHNNLVRGSQGDDRIAANGYIDELHGEGGDDVFLYSGSNAGADTLDGGAGLDRVQGSDGDDRIALDAFSGIEAIDGGAGRDVIAGSDGGREEWDFSGVELTGIELIDAGGHHDLVIGSAGDDHIRGGDGWDEIDGGDGYDVAYFDGQFADYDLRQKSDGLVVEALVTGEGRDKVTNVEALRFADGVYTDGDFQMVGINNETEQMVYDGV